MGIFTKRSRTHFVRGNSGQVIDVQRSDKPKLSEAVKEFQKNNNKKKNFLKEKIKSELKKSKARKEIYREAYKKAEKKELIAKAGRRAKEKYRNSNRGFASGFVSDPFGTTTTKTNYPRHKKKKAKYVKIGNKAYKVASKSKKKTKNMMDDLMNAGNGFL